MRFDVVIGNPPYQEGDSGHGQSAAPIYHRFFRQAIALRPQSICMIMPSRWFSGGKGLATFRQEMLRDDDIRLIDDFPDGGEVFDDVQIKGGVSIVVREETSTSLMKIISNLDPENPVSFTRNHSDSQVDVFLRFPHAESILEKIEIVESELSKTDRSMGQLVSVRRPFGLAAEERGDPKAPHESSFILHHKGGQSRIQKDHVISGKYLAESWKVFIPRLANGSDSLPHPVLGRAFVGTPGEVCTETFLAIGPFPSAMIAMNVKGYLETRLFRYLCLLRKSSQDTPRTVFNFVPTQDFEQSWSDEELRNLYKIEDGEWEEIVKLVSEVV